MKKTAGDIIILQSYDVRFLRYGVRQTEFFLSFWAIFSHFTPLTTPKIKIFKKFKKCPWDILSFYTCVPYSQGDKGVKMDNLGENFLDAPFDSLGCLLFRITCWSFWNLFKMCTSQTRINRPKIVLYEKKKCIFGKNGQFWAL